jgi:hypothetical protein
MNICSFCTSEIAKRSVKLFQNTNKTFLSKTTPQNSTTHNTIRLKHEELKKEFGKQDVPAYGYNTETAGGWDDALLRRRVATPYIYPSGKVPTMLTMEVWNSIHPSLYNHTKEYNARRTKANLVGLAIFGVCTAIFFYTTWKFSAYDFAGKQFLFHFFALFHNKSH